jgi:hypothetical protein
MSEILLSVGAMKAGTTWLYDKLRQHPDIAFSQEKEIHFLAQKYNVTNSLSLDKRVRRMQAALRRSIRRDESKELLIEKIEWYEKYLSDPINDQWFYNLFSLEQKKKKYLADFSNLNCHLESIDWGCEIGSGTKIRAIYIIRDPIKRIWSHYKYHLQFTNHALKNAPDSDLDLFITTIEKPSFRRNADYAKVLSNLKFLVDQRSLMLIYFERMVKEPKNTLEDILDFLEVRKHSFSEEYLGAKKNASIECPLPTEWKSIIKDKFGSEFSAVKSLGLWSEEWAE